MRGNLIFPNSYGSCANRLIGRVRQTGLQNGSVHIASWRSCRAYSFRNSVNRETKKSREAQVGALNKNRDKNGGGI